MSDPLDPPANNPSDASVPAAPAVLPAAPIAEPLACENCGAPLQGEYCHACGQSIHNPIRHAGHAIEELFESLWHLDGRVFRTLRDLLVPGRVACGYLAGHRARYIAPLRVFVVLSVLTFFIGQFTVDFGDATIDIGNQNNAISRADTVAEVERVRDEQLKALAEAGAASRGVPGAGVWLPAAETELREQAAARIGELQPPPATAAAPAKTPSATPATVDAPASAVADPGAPGEDGGNLRFFNGEPWHETRNPLALPWLPAFANRWLNHKVARVVANAPRLQEDAELRKRVVLGSVPTALFVLMPLFALLLKIAYFGKRRMYLEHLVVALYSHAFLLVALLGIFVLVGLDGWLSPRIPAVAGLFGWLEGALWFAMPIYLLIMQKRVYGQGWTMTTFKYFVLGSAYMVLVTFAALFAGVAGVAKL